MVDYRQFFEKIRIDRASSNVNCVSMSKSKYDDLVNKVKSLKTKIRKEGNDYRFLKRYDVLKVNGITKLISPVNESACVKYFVHDEELHDVLHDAHICTGHGGRDRMMKNLKRKYMNVTYKDVQTYLSLCEPCLHRQKSQKKKVVTRPMLFQDLNSRCQVDLIDFQSQPDEEYKFIMVYQDHLTKFVVLKPLKSKRAEEVCDNIVDIFTLLGAPSVLQSDNGREFANKITNNLKNLWPNFKIVHGKPRHSESQGSVERVNQDVENMLTTWMQDSKTSHWSQGLKYVQLMKNCAFHSEIKRSPYEAMFGCPPKHGLASSGIAAEALENVTSEEELEEVIIRINMASEEATKQETEPEINTTQFQDRENLFEEESGNIKDECILTDLGQCTELISNQREEAFNSLSDQAKRMKRSSDQRLPPVEKGATVRIPVPDVDRAEGDARFILAVVLEVVDEGFYRLGTRDGVLKQLYARSQFSSCSQNIIKESEGPLDKEVALRTVATFQSTGSGEGFFKCTCHTKCQTMKCRCKKNNVLCNSKCHNSLSCCNK